jgi:hypothetical protein
VIFFQISARLFFPKYKITFAQHSFKKNQPMRPILLIISLLCSIFASAQDEKVKKAPPRAEGDGPFSQLIIRGVTLINGNGAPPVGPVDIVCEGNRIKKIANVGHPGLPIDSASRPKLLPGGHELDANGMYLMPGFVDMHGHIGGTQAPDAEYVFKLWLGHGITTIRDPACGGGLDWVLDEKAKSAKNEITAPRIKAYQVFGGGWEKQISTPDEARQWVRENAKKGADGIKFFGANPNLMTAALDENKKLGLRSACHHAQMDVARWNVLNSARAGLTTMEHWYGLPEALFEHQTVQDYPLDYNYSDEQNRFENAGNLWKQAAPPFSAKWNSVMDTLILRLTQLSIFMMPRVICTAPDGSNGIKSTRCRVCGDFLCPIGCRTARIGSIGGRSRRSIGKKITDFG